MLPCFILRKMNIAWRRHQPMSAQVHSWSGAFFMPTTDGSVYRKR